MPWDHPKGVAAAVRTNAKAGPTALRHYADDMWDTMTALADEFTTADVVADLMDRHGIAKTSALTYWTCFKAYCYAAPGDFHGPKAVLQKRGNRYRLVDAADVGDYS